jgi:hypothetical protein
MRTSLADPLAGHLQYGNGGSRFARPRRGAEKRFPASAKKVQIRMSDEQARHVGPVMAAASLPEL